MQLRQALRSEVFALFPTVGIQPMFPARQAVVGIPGTPTGNPTRHSPSKKQYDRKSATLTTVRTSM